MGNAAPVIAREELGTDAMTNASVLGLGPGAGIAPLRGKWGWIVALGVVYLVAGVIALGSVVMATVATVYVVGIMMIIAGVFEVIHSFQIKSWGRFIFWLLLGVLYIIAGFIGVRQSTADRRLADAHSWRGAGCLRHHARLPRLQHEGRDAMGLGRCFRPVTLLLGIIILIHWPVSSLYVLGIFLGIDLVFAGASWIGLGLGLRQAA